jgi:hypothetical protein
MQQRRRSGPSDLPLKAEVVHALDTLEAGITEMVARWHDGIPAPIRAELLRISQPALELLVRLRRR